ncbi:MAG: DUF1657 domain-containing protein [Bacillota bacterium]|nr:DUF1657 domain-containing protein [Bacillota bacterium]MDD3851983.1 DUF1657 domain-containing protein [Bacillota bacterium]
MTVGTQLQQAIASVQSTATSMRTFAIETEDGQAKQTFQQLAQTLDSAVQTLKDRQKYVESQEPQYRQQ